MRTKMMFRNLSGIIFMAFLLTSVSLNAQVTKEEISKVIKIDKLQHPYLFFTNESKHQIMDRIKSDRESQRIWESLLAKGHRYLYVPIKNPAPAQPIHPRFEAEDPSIAYGNELIDGTLTMAFLYQMTGNVSYAKKSIEFATAIVNLPDWVDNAHKFDVIYSRVWPYNVPDDQVNFSYDIFAAGKAHTLAIAYDWLYPILTLEQRDKIRNGLLEKAVTRVRGNYEFYWWASAYRCNWSAICNTGIGLSALAMLKESPQLLDVVATTYNNIGLTFDNIDQDGGWQEGRGYYSYMMRESVLFIDALKNLTNGKFNLFNHNKVKDHPIDFFLYGLTANFGDSEGYPAGPTFLVNKLVQETGNTTGAWYREKFLREGTELYDLIWPRSSVKAIEPEQKSKVFKGINWAIMRSSFTDPSSFTVVCKAGYNDDPHHGHLDCGQFALNWYGVPFIRDLGRMEYDELYFSEDRFDYPYASSLGHNVIHVNDEQQIIAKKKNQPWKQGIGGEILDFRTSTKRDYVLMDPTHAYPNKELKKWRRGIVLEKPVVTVVFDEIGSELGAKISARFFPNTQSSPSFSRNNNRTGRMFQDAGFDYKVFNNYVLLSSQNHNLALIPLVLDGDFNIVEDRLSYMPVMENARPNEIPYFETVTKAKSSSSIIVTLIVPVKDQSDAVNVVKSAKVNQLNPKEIEVSVNSTAGSFNWHFEKNDDGYMLKD
jgi:hypothetical protein